MFTISAAAISSNKPTAFSCLTIIKNGGVHILDIRSVTPTICRLMGVNPPSQSITEIQTNLISALRQDGIRKINKCLIYAPDAIGCAIQSKYPELFTGIKHIIKHSEPLQSMYPSVTPICYASMFTGASPEIHGIQRYEKPVIRIETIFDAMLAGGKKVAIFAVKNCSIDLLFKERALDYYSADNDETINEQAFPLFADYDFAVLYNCEYDSNLHRSQPFSDQCLDAVEHHNQTYVKLAEAAGKAWKEYNWLLVYAPDHGAHKNPADNVGTHGLNIPEDMDILHHYVYSKAVK